MSRFASNGMPCPECGCPGRLVLESRWRPSSRAIYRRCACPDCNARYSTYETLNGDPRPSAKPAKTSSLAAASQIERIERSLAALRRLLK